MSTVKQVGGDHYQKPIQAWDYIVANKLGFLEGNVVKYVSRWEDKDGLKDLEKCLSYVQKLIEVEKARLAALEPVKEGEGWIVWDGFRGKHREFDKEAQRTQVAVQFRNGEKTIGQVQTFDWMHYGAYHDIVKYKLTEV